MHGGLIPRIVGHLLGWTLIAAGIATPLVVRSHEDAFPPPEIVGVPGAIYCYHNDELDKRICLMNRTPMPSWLPPDYR